MKRPLPQIAQDYKQDGADCRKLIRTMARQGSRNLKERLMMSRQGQAVESGCVLR
jgi:hypothetical protein